MRALAVVAVMVYHANSTWLPGGFLGVEMFFVISGYLITLLLIAERERDYRISLTAFWLRRAKRLLPALFVLMILLSVWTAVFERDALGQLRGDLVAGFFYVSNWYQLWVGLGYTSSGDFAPLRHLWSLAVEEQFYLIWPIVMVVILGRSGTRRIAGMSRWLFASAIVVTVLVTIAYHAGPIGEPALTPEAYWWIGDRPISKIDTLYLSTIARAGGLLLGAAMAMLWRPYAIMRGPLRARGGVFDAVALLALVGFGWMCWDIFLIQPGGADPRLFRFGLFVAGVLTLLIIAAVTHPGARANRILGTGVLVWIGKRSYGLYLYHWPVYQIIRNVAGNKLTLFEFVVAMVITVVITELSYRFVETPIRTGQFGAMVRRVRRHRTPAQKGVLVGAMAVTVALSVFAGATLATAELKQNDIAVSLDDGADFTIDLASDSSAATRIAPPSTTASSTPVPTVLGTAPTTPQSTTTAPLFEPTITVNAPGSVANTTQPEVAATTIPVPPSTAAPDPDRVVVPASTVAPAAPVTQRGLIVDVNAIQPLTIPVVDGGLPLVALGDSVMLGAAEELTAAGFVVDAVKSRQMVSFLPDMSMIRDTGAFGPVVVVHLGTNGPFSDTTLASMMALLADVPLVILLTGRGDLDWLSDNNLKIRALPSQFANVTVLDWEVLADACEGRCFYDDGVHLTQSGQNFYASLVKRLLGLA